MYSKYLAKYIGIEMVQIIYKQFNKVNMTYHKTNSIFRINLTIINHRTLNSNASYKSHTFNNLNSILELFKLSNFISLGTDFPVWQALLIAFN